MRATRAKIADQAKRSKVAVAARCPAARNPEPATTSAAIDWARVVPPISRAMTAARATHAVTARAGRIRIAQGSRPSSWTAAAVSSGVSGGWST